MKPAGGEIPKAVTMAPHRGNFTVTLGLTTAAYRGELAMDEVDEEALRSVMRARGPNERGQGSAKATIVGSMSPDVSNRLLRDSSDCLQKAIESAEPAEATDAGPEQSVSAPPVPAPARPPAEPVGGLSLVLRALFDRLKRLFKRS